MHQIGWRRKIVGVVELDCLAAKSMPGDPISLKLKRFGAVFCVQASIRRVTFEALSLDEAQQLAASWGFGLDGESSLEPDVEDADHVVAEALDVKSACRVLGGISRTTLYRLLVKGQLERLPSTRKVLVTRRSIGRYCSRAT